VEFEWDLRKSSLNLRKHGIALEDAVALFNHPYLERPDDRHDYGEERWIVTGQVAGDVIVVNYVWRGERRRIISAREAQKTEREAYYSAVYSH
jgi:uncharacterized DUF497 family protein